MHARTYILVIAHPGHFRESLAALLKTIPQCRLFLADSAFRLNPGPQRPASPQVALLELSALGPSPAEFLAGLRKRWPGIRCILLVDSARSTVAARALGADLALTQDVSAGDLLRAVQQVGTVRGRPGKPQAGMTAVAGD